MKKSSLSRASQFKTNSSLSKAPERCRAAIELNCSSIFMPPENPTTTIQKEQVNNSISSCSSSQSTFLSEAGVKTNTGGLLTKPRKESKPRKALSKSTGVELKVKN